MQYQASSDQKAFVHKINTKRKTGYLKYAFRFFFQGFTLEFYFDTNDFFTNTVLTKHYSMRSEPDEEDPFSFEGPEIVKCKGYDNSLF